MTMTAPEMPEAMAAPDASSAAHRAESTAEFVYGTTGVLIALSGLELVGGVAPEKAAAVTLAGAVAIWLSHAYATYLGAHVVGDPRHTFGILYALRRSFPIVVAAVPAALLLAGSVVGWWSASTAILLANWLAIVVLAVAGWIGARATGSGYGVAAGWAAMTASIGVGIVLLESLLHT